MTIDFTTAQQLVISLGLGMLIGLQRERTQSALGGIRTFPLITLLGTVNGLLANVYGGWIIAAGFLALAVLMFMSNIPKLREGTANGLTTEVAMLLLYALGAFVVSGSMFLAVVLGGAVAQLLHWKQPLHRFANAVGDTDMRAIMQFVLISMVILPVLPNESFGLYGVFNPFEIWLMVVLIVGISLVGYVVYKLFGKTSGVLLSGIVGGIISSTATALTSARRCKNSTAAVGLVSTIVMIASAVSVIRILVEIGAVAPRSFSALAMPLGAMLGAMTLIAAGGYLVTRNEDAELPEQKNPAQLKAALILAALYAIIKLAVAAAKDHFGNSGLYVVSIISGLTNMDAVTLSTARLVENQTVDITTGWRTLLIGTMSNIVFKGGAIAVLGNRRLFAYIAVLFGLSLAAGGLILWLWPAGEPAPQK